MPRIKGTTGTGITTNAIVQFDGNNPADADELVTAAIRTFDRTFYSRASKALRQNAVATLSAHKLPSDIEVYYASDGGKWSERQRSPDEQGLELWELVSRRGFAEDSPCGYSVRLLYMLNTVDTLAREQRYDEALAMALETGRLIAAADIKEIWEEDAVRGYKSVEGARMGHAAVHGTAFEKAARQKEHVRAFEKYRTQGRGILAAYEAAAKECGVSRRSIQRSVAGK